MLGEFKKRIEEISWMDDYCDCYCNPDKVLKIIEEAKKEFPKIKPSHPMDPVWDFNKWFKKWFGDE